ncbi:MAG: hypothetical protein JWM64_795 [Frankiales bacterium]|nr:hypothetical protein [Frankiales bacterium]
MLQTLVAVLLPSGGQLHARRNAWAAMSEGAVRARATRDADAAMAEAVERANARSEPVRAAR